MGNSMILKMRCSYCSELKEVKCDNPNTAKGRLETAAKNGWSGQFFSNKALLVYWCSGRCEHNYRIEERLHLKIVGSVTRNG